jgi:hypothetical protein
MRNKEPLTALEIYLRWEGQVLQAENEYEAERCRCIMDRIWHSELTDEDREKLNQRVAGEKED